MSSLKHSDPEQELGHLDGAGAGRLVVWLAWLVFLCLVVWKKAANCCVPRRANRPAVFTPHLDPDHD